MTPLLAACYPSQLRHTNLCDAWFLLASAWLLCLFEAAGGVLLLDLRSNLLVKHR